MLESIVNSVRSTATPTWPRGNARASCSRPTKATLSGCPVDEATYTFTSCMDAGLSTLVVHLLDGDSEAALAEARRVRASQPDGQRLLVEGLEAAMDG